MSRQPSDWMAFARACAGDAFCSHFSSRRGVWHIADWDALVLFNNHPHTSRDEETAELRRRLAAEGIEELAYATYPEMGPDAGYTYAMILRAGEDRLPWLAEMAVDIFCQGLVMSPHGSPAVSS